MVGSYEALRCLMPAGGEAGLAVGSRSLAPARQALVAHGLEGEVPVAATDLILLSCAREADDPGALLCLRCRVSWPLEAAAQAIQRQFGQSYGLDLPTLAGFVLDDDGRLLGWERPEPMPRRADPFSVEVVRSYVPGHCGLPHWARQRFRSHPGLKAHLRQQGLRMITDWALLADASARQIRQAWETHGEGAPLSGDDAVALFKAYVPVYRQAKDAYIARTGRQQGWLPDAAFFEAVAPGQPAEQTSDALQTLAKALRKQLRPPTVSIEERSLEGLAEPIDPRSLVDPDGAEQADSQALVAAIGAALQRALDIYMPAALRGDAQTSPAARQLLRCLWQNYAAGFGQRQLAERCGCSQPTVSRRLQLDLHSRAVAAHAAAELVRQPAFQALRQSPQAAERLSEALRNHLLDSEPEGDVPSLRRWLQHSMPSS